jgi:hypothetical protein
MDVLRQAKDEAADSRLKMGAEFAIIRVEIVAPRGVAVQVAAAGRAPSALAVLAW